MPPIEVTCRGFRLCGDLSQSHARFFFALQLHQQELRFNVRYSDARGHHTALLRSGSDAGGGGPGDVDRFASAATAVIFPPRYPLRDMLHSRSNLELRERELAAYFRSLLAAGEVTTLHEACCLLGVRATAVRPRRRRLAAASTAASVAQSGSGADGGSGDSGDGGDAAVAVRTNQRVEDEAGAEERGSTARGRHVRHLQRVLPSFDWSGTVAGRITSPPCDVTDRVTCAAIVAHSRACLLDFERRTTWSVLTASSSTEGVQMEASESRPGWPVRGLRATVSSATQAATIRAAFERFDVDGDGRLSEAEFAELQRRKSRAIWSDPLPQGQGAWGRLCERLGCAEPARGLTVAHFEVLVSTLLLPAMPRAMCALMWLPTFVAGRSQDILSISRLGSVAPAAADAGAPDDLCVVLEENKTPWPLSTRSRVYLYERHLSDDGMALTFSFRSVETPLCPRDGSNSGSSVRSETEQLFTMVYDPRRGTLDVKVLAFVDPVLPSVAEGLLVRTMADLARKRLEADVIFGYEPERGHEPELDAARWPSPGSAVVAAGSTATAPPPPPPTATATAMVTGSAQLLPQPQWVDVGEAQPVVGDVRAVADRPASCRAPQQMAATAAAVSPRWWASGRAALNKGRHGWRLYAAAAPVLLLCWLFAFVLRTVQSQAVVDVLPL